MLFDFSKLRTAMKFSNLPTFINPNQKDNTGKNFDKLKQSLVYTYGVLSLGVIGTSAYAGIFKEEELIKKYGKEEILKARIASRLIP